MTPWHLRQAASILHAGGVIAYPTETVYGLGCDPLNYSAIERLLALKQRPVEKGLILIGARLEQLWPYIDVSDDQLLQKLQTPTPQPTTWVVPARNHTPSWLSGQHDSIAVRISSNPIAAEICNHFNGAIVSTSANPARLPPARSALTIKRYFDDELDYLLHATTKPDNKPSEIRDLLSDKRFRSSEKQPKPDRIAQPKI